MTSYGTESSIDSYLSTGDTVGTGSQSADNRTYTDIAQTYVQSIDNTDVQIAEYEATKVVKCRRYVLYKKESSEKNGINIESSFN